MIKGTDEWKERHEKLARLVDENEALDAGNGYGTGYKILSVEEHNRRPFIVQQEIEHQRILDENTFYEDDDYKEGDGMCIRLEGDELFIDSPSEGGHTGNEVFIKISDLINFLKEKGAI